MFIWIIAVTIGAFAAYFSNFKSYGHNTLAAPRYTQVNNTICDVLAQKVPEVVFSSHQAEFHSSISSYWSQNAREVDPHCILRPSTAQQLSSAVRVLKLEFDSPQYPDTPLRFAVKSGGHSPEKGAAGVDAGVIIDLALFNDVLVSEDRQFATIGVGSRWGQVSSKLDGMGLAVIGGRNADVGVGGLALGGGISFFSPRYGFVCDNIEEYQVVLANGTIVHATATQHASLWKALKGGGGNFGIVTQIRTRLIVSSKIWSGYLFSPSWQTPKIIEAFIDLCKADNFDEFVAGPVVALVYVQKLGIRLTATGLAYTKPEKWPKAYKVFKSFWPAWSTHKVQPLSSASKELHDLAASGYRQAQMTTTVKADLDTLLAFNDIFLDTIPAFKRIKGGVLSPIFQPLCPAAVGGGSSNMLGLALEPTADCLVIILLYTTWERAEDDDFAHEITRDLMSTFDKAAQDRGTAHSFRYLNYAGSTQRPIDSYGDKNKKFLQEISKVYDPQGFFQLAKKGGFHLDLYDKN